jgi:hypothetical protein
MSDGRRSFTKMPSPSVVVACIALLVAASGIAYGAIPGSSGTINACYKNQNGRRRVIDTEKSPSESASGPKPRSNGVSRDRRATAVFSVFTSAFRRSACHRWTGCARL